VHPTQEGMERHMRVDRGEVQVTLVEQAPKPEAPVYLALPMWALMLLAYESHFQWPAREFIDAVTVVLNSGD
jgi:hypothetical protein